MEETEIGGNPETTTGVIIVNDIPIEHWEARSVLGNTSM